MNQIDKNCLFYCIQIHNLLLQNRNFSINSKNSSVLLNKKVSLKLNQKNNYEYINRRIYSNFTEELNSFINPIFAPIHAHSYFNP